MRRAIVSRLLGVMMAVCLLTGSTSVGLASVVFDDHFTGNSGGVPADWSHFLGTGTVVEAGTTVTVDGVIDGIVAILSDAIIDPSTGTVRIEADIAGLAGQGGVGFVTRPTTGFFCAIRLEDGRIEVNVADAEGGNQWYDVGNLVGYTGGPIRLTIMLGPTVFSVSTDSPAFSSGPIDYTTAFSIFTRDDLGTASSVMILDYGDPGSLIVDRVTVDVAPPVAVESLSFGQVKALYRR